ncbi:MAG TPA: MbtH family protein [Longimicrobium sp.]|jgi:MbtH protein
MPTEANEDTRTYIVLVNHEEQYSLWLADRQVPPGWKAVGGPGSRAECLEYVKEVWTDMRPLSLRGGAERPAEAHGETVRLTYSDGQPLDLGGEA